MHGSHFETAKTLAILTGMALCICGLLIIAAVAISDALGLHLFY